MRSCRLSRDCFPAHFFLDRTDLPPKSRKPAPSTNTRISILKFLSVFVSSFLYRFLEVTFKIFPKKGNETAKWRRKHLLETFLEWKCIRIILLIRILEVGNKWKMIEERKEIISSIISRSVIDRRRIVRMPRATNALFHSPREKLSWREIAFTRGFSMNFNHILAMEERIGEFTFFCNANINLCRITKDGLIS